MSDSEPSRSLLAALVMTAALAGVVLALVAGALVLIDYLIP